MQIPPHRWLLVRKVGWHWPQFALPGQTIGIGDPKIRLMGDDWHEAQDFKMRGNLRDWKEKVARLCGSSSRLILSICFSLAAPLLKFAPAGLESGGCHFSGASSQGKTLLLLVAQSVNGIARRNRLGTWNTTLPGLIDTAAALNDTVLCLDELEVALRNRDIGPNGIGQTAFVLAGGQAKRVSKTSIHHREKELQTFRIIFISSGERSLYEVAQLTGKIRLAGEEVRFVEVPAEPEGGSGIFNPVPQGVRRNASRLAEEIETNARRYGGAALRRFVRGVARTPNIRRKVRALIDEFYRIASVPIENGKQKRIASRFALASAAAQLGIELGVLPWDRELVNESIIACYRDAMAAMPTTAPQVGIALHRLRNAIRSHGRTLDVRSRRVAASAKGGKQTILRRKIQGRDCYLFRKGQLKKIIAGAAPIGLVLQELDRRRLLVRDRGRGLPTVQVRASGRSRRRYYAIRRKVAR